MLISSWIRTLYGRKPARMKTRLPIRYGLESLELRDLLASIPVELFDGVTAPTLPSGWTQSTTSSNPWTTVANTSDSAPNHAFVANPANNSDSILTSPTFTLSAATPLLSFRNNFDTEETWDGGVLEISIASVNGGAYADIVTAGGSFVSGGYVSALVMPGNGNSNPLAGRQAWHGTSNGYITTVVNLPAAALNQNVALRWRFGSDSSVGDTGWRIDTITLESLPTDDFGDAPTSYPVTLAENGARHTVGSLFLGTQVDAEADGSHSPDAVADGADEDGVGLQGTFARGNSTTIQVTASQAGGLLNAWFDWNADGDWADSGEQAFVNQALAAGANSLSVSVPANAKIGSTFARFRLGTTSGLSFTGAAADGEVEDYRVSVIGAGAWNSLGPFGATNGQVEGIANRPVVGAVHTVLAHPTNPDILYIGATNGGVWKTTNATSSSPNWTPLTDGVASQSIGALAFDLADSTFNTIYAGIGQYSSFSRIGNTRIGLIRSTDGGQNWQVVNGGGILQGKNISGVYANGSTVVVSVNVADAFTFNNIGIFRSTNGGSTFSQISSGSGATTGLPGGVSYDLVFDPVTPTTLYTSTVFSDNVGGVNGVYKSTNSGANWVKVSTPAMDALITNNTSNLELAVGRSNEVYAGIINAGAFAGLFRSPNGGGAWSQMDSPKTNENGTDVGLNPSGGKGPSTGTPEQIAGGQGAIHFSIVADPNNSNLVYVGGDRQPRTFGDTGSFPNSIGANDFSGRLFRGNASLASGSQFVHLTHSNTLGAVGGGTASNSSPHADSREMTFDANGNLIEVDDGGIYRRTSPQNNTGDWFSMIGNLSVTEAHDVAWDSLSNVAITGNQDTGTTYQPSENASQWVSLSTADGGDVAVDNIQLAGSNQSVRYTSFQNLNAFRRTVWNAAGGLVSTTFPTLNPNGGAARITGAFRTPVETNSVTGGRLLIQGSNGLYESLDAGATVNAIGVGRGVSNSGLFQNAIWYGGTQNAVANPDLVWAASNSDVFVRTSGTGNVVAVPTDPTTAEIRDLAVNSRDWANAFVIDDNQVFQTTNVGSSWSDVTGNLLTFASSLRSIAFVAGTVTNSIVVGTNVGVFASLTNALGTWFQVGIGLPNVISYDLEFDATDDTLVVGTMGRGAWSLLNATQVVTDRTAPVTTSFARSVPLSATTDADTLVFVATFNEPVTGVDAGDFVVTGTTGSIAVNQLTTSTYSITISGGDLANLNGTVGLNLSASPTITDFALNVLSNAEPSIDEVYVVDNNALNVPPTVTAVYVRGSAWDASYLNYLQANNLGSSTLGYAIPATMQLANLPWRNLDRISLVFSEDVTINGGDLRVLGVRTAEYAMLAGGPGFSYNAATRTATYTLATPIANDKVRLWLNSGPTAVRDLQGAALDGEWGTNGAGGDVAPIGDTFPSGDGTAGGVFRFRMNVVPGDVNASGNVDAIDVAAIYSPIDINTTHASYRPLRDVDGNGAINQLDADFIRSRRALAFKSLPTGSPPLDPVGAMGASADSGASVGTPLNLGSAQSTPTTGAKPLTIVNGSSVVSLSSANTASASVMAASRPRQAATPTVTQKALSAQSGANVRDAFFSNDGLWF